MVGGVAVGFASAAVAVGFFKIGRSGSLSLGGGVFELVDDAVVGALAESEAFGPRF